MSKSKNIIVTASVIFCLIFLPLTGMANEIHEKVKKAKAELQEGTNSWDVEKLKSAKDMFLNLLLEEESENAFLHYYIALCGYRLATYDMSENLMDEAGIHTADAQQHLEKVMKLKPTWGEPFAMYATLMGFEIALDWNKAMTIGMEIPGYFSKAFELEPNNPRINLLKGSSDLYTPEEYGGGPNVAIGSLAHAVALFEKENVQDPMMPSWGKEEALTFLGIAYMQKGDKDKAAELFQKALTVNPEFSMAIENLDQLKK